MRTSSHRHARTSGGAASSRAAPGGAGVPPAIDFDALPPLDPALLRGSINTLRHSKRTIIQTVCVHADRIHGLLPHLTCTVGGLDELLSLLAFALPPEARP